MVLMMLFPPTTIVMAGLVPAIHEHPCNREIMDRRHKAGDDGCRIGERDE